MAATTPAWHRPSTTPPIRTASSASSSAAATAANGDANTTIAVEYGSNLDGWTTAMHQGTGANQITISENPYSSGPGIDKVTVALPASLAGGGKLFARLKVVVIAEP